MNEPLPPPAPPAICPRCHQSVLPEYYFCPNCGVKLSDPPLGTGIADQVLLYAFSVVLPWILYIAVTRWRGLRYLRSPDPRARQIGTIAAVFLALSSVLMIWSCYESFVLVQNYLQQSLNSGLDGVGGF